MSKKMKWLHFGFLLFTFEYSICQTPEVLQVRKYVTQREHVIIDEFMSFLSIPNVASDSVNIRRNAALIQEMMRKRGIENIQLLTGINDRFPPVVYGEVKTPGAKETIIYYAHYDGQPVNPDQWARGLDPFNPKLYSGSIPNGGKEISVSKSSRFDPETRIYARGSSDDKAGVIAVLNAYDAVIANGLKPTHNIKFFFEGEEEAGSPHLQEILEKYKALLQSDCWIICDGPVHQTGKKQIVFGVRGDAHLDLTVYGPKRPLHSGHYGNWAPNPAMMLAKLLASMKDEEGKVTIKGFYDDVKPLSDLEQKAIKDVPSVDQQMKKELGLKEAEFKGKSLGEAINLPSLNINGMQSGNVGKLASNQIPTSATVVLDLRLVVGNDWKKQQQKVIDHIRNQGYTVIDHEPTDAERLEHSKLVKVASDDFAYNAQRTSMDLPIAKKIIAAVQSTTSEQVVLQPTSGGSLPLYMIEKYLSSKSITVPIVNHDNNQHAENENIRLANLWSGIETMAAIMRMK
ncbi:MAG TPA: M20/M25/M40 family metallo-hydrolase [Chitinophagaceae bacterium]|nr:M20/M25/M40 family metallo-hydrolase [Chitinophagaceae bacterium]